jgi:hypothetical protein
MDHLIDNLKKQYSFEEYVEMVKKHAEKGDTSGIEKSLEKINFTKLNAQRLSRISKQIESSLTPFPIAYTPKNKLKWILLAEAWCGDVAQNLPYIASISKRVQNIDLKILLRDENPELMNEHLTNGTRSIPKLICLNESGKCIGSWGPRPASIAAEAKKIKASDATISHEEFVKQVQLAYHRDGGVSVSQEFCSLLEEWDKKSDSDI